MPSYSKRRSLQSYIRIWTVPVVAFSCLAWSAYQEIGFRHRQRVAWVSATATVADARIRPLARFAFEYGGKELYEVDVLATYTLAGQAHQDWVPLAAAPEVAAKAQQAASELKGKRCVVRWDPASPEQKDAELF